MIEIKSKIEFLSEKSNPAIPVYLFSYDIDIVNKSNSPVTLLNRYWKITDGNGVVNTVNGKGVVGLQPKIQSNDSFRYTSFCPLPTDIGIMDGWYEMKYENGNVFKQEIPTINLFTPQSKN